METCCFCGYWSAWNSQGKKTSSRNRDERDSKSSYKLNLMNLSSTAVCSSVFNICMECKNVHGQDISKSVLTAAKNMS